MTSPAGRRSGWHGLLTPSNPGTRCNFTTIYRYLTPIRLALNYKNLKYKTEWIEYPDIEAHCKKIGAPPTDKKADGRDHYTLPVIYDPSTKAVVADSIAIVKYLDTAYPDTPQLFPDGTDAFQTAYNMLIRPTVIMPMLNIIVCRICGILNPPSAEYFRKTREVQFGKKLEELGTESDWTALEAGLERVKVCLDANGKGKDLLAMGDKITFADLLLASILIWGRVVTGEDSEDWKRITALHDGKWAKFLEQFTKYEFVDV